MRAAVFHLYDLNELKAIPKRYTIGPNDDASYSVPKGKFDLWVTGPNSFHRHFKGSEIPFFAFVDERGLIVKNETQFPLKISCRDNAYGLPPQPIEIEPGEGVEITVPLDLAKTYGWYDFSLSTEDYSVRLAGHIEDGKPSMSDPAAFGPARLTP